MEAPVHMRGGLVKLFVKGKKNEDAIKKRRGEGRHRVAMTEAIMLLLKERIRSWDESAEGKLLLWAVCTIAFAGAFRIHEILCRLESTFDPDFELLWRDVQERQDSISFVLRCLKEQKKAAPTVVDIFANGGLLCPIAAYSKWRRKVQPDREMPVFRCPGGQPLTGKKLNELLSGFLSGELQGGGGTISTHSFRWLRRVLRKMTLKLSDGGLVGPMRCILSTPGQSGQKWRAPQ
jgi:hypothetical protein